MRSKSASPQKKFFTIEQANQMLPLVRAIVQDVADLARDLIDRQERLNRIHPRQKAKALDAYDEEYVSLENEFARNAARMEEFVDELRKLGVEIKGWDGIIDFPGLMDGREVCLCWKLGEPEVSHWHEIDAGFAGRQPLHDEAFVCAGEQGGVS